MPYPLILAANGDIFARLNADRDWSVRWERVFDVAYLPPQPRSRAIIAYAKLFLAARDNFFQKPWELGDTAAWEHYEAVIDLMDSEPSPGQWLSTIAFNSDFLVRVNYDGTWSVRWDEVLPWARSDNPHYGITALVGICRILRAAQDRFVVAPWDTDEEDE